MPYDPKFVPGHTIPLPVPRQRLLQTAFGADYIHHSRFSLLFNQARGFAFVSAHNIDGRTIPVKQYTTRSFKFDPKIKPNALQVDADRGYRNNHWDQGHLARRKSMSWGREADARIAERESDHWSNVAPQHENLHDDAWGRIEDWMLKRVQSDSRRASVFTGPVFTDDDPEHKNAPGETPIRIPAGFWKVMCVELDGAMRAAGFLVWQRDYDSVKPLSFNPVLEQVRLTTIEVLTGLTFPALRKFDPLLFDRRKRALTPATSLARADFRGRMLPGLAAVPRGRFAGISSRDVIAATAPGTAAITDMRDIVL